MSLLVLLNARNHRLVFGAVSLEFRTVQADMPYDASFNPSAV